VEKRRDLYRQIMETALGRDRMRIYLWHRKNVMIHSTRLTGYQPNPDGMIRLQGMRLN
jgi:peptide/nickel transport system substrate-binding protein